MDQVWPSSVWIFRFFRGSTAFTLAAMDPSWWKSMFFNWKAMEGLKHPVLLRLPPGLRRYLGCSRDLRSFRWSVSEKSHVTFCSFSCFLMFSHVFSCFSEFPTRQLDLQITSDVSVSMRWKMPEVRSFGRTHQDTTTHFGFWWFLHASWANACRMALGVNLTWKIMEVTRFQQAETCWKKRWEKF